MTIAELKINCAEFHKCITRCHTYYMPYLDSWNPLNFFAEMCEKIKIDLQTNHSSFCEFVVCDRSGPTCLNLPGTKWDGLWPSAICVLCGGTLMVPQGDASFPTTAMSFRAIMYRHRCHRDVSVLMNHSIQFDVLFICTQKGTTIW